MARPRGTEDLVRRTITIPRSLLQQIESEVLAIKQSGRSASVSAVIREALERRRE